ncbi:hypothetical protein ACFQ2M_41435 [Kitasatospora saccharophila]
MANKARNNFQELPRDLGPNSNCRAREAAGMPVQPRRPLPS